MREAASHDGLTKKVLKGRLGEQRLRVSAKTAGVGGGDGLGGIVDGPRWTSIGRDGFSSSHKSHELHQCLGLCLSRYFFTIHRNSAKNLCRNFSFH